MNNVKRKTARLTQSEKNRIARLTLRGHRQSEIAARLGVTPATVRNAQKKLHLPTKLATPEQRICELLQGGMCGHRVAETLKLSVDQVYRTARKHNLQRQVIYRPKQSPKHETDAFISIISKIRRDYCKGQLVSPDREDEFVEAICDKFVDADVPANLREGVSEKYRSGLLAAVHTLRAVNSMQFLN